MKVVIITNIPVPYRIPIYNILSNYEDIDLVVGYMASIEENRKWTLPEFEHNHHFLPKLKTFAKKDGFNFVHFNKGVIKLLNTINPEVVITTGFNPAHLQGWFWTRKNKKAHIAMSDGWLKSEEILGPIHRLMRTVILKRSEAFIGASRQTFKLFEHYGAQADRIYQSALVVDNTKFSQQYNSFENRAFDVIFSGTLQDHKNPFFITNVLEILKSRSVLVNALFLGKGPLKKELEKRLEKLGVSYSLPGHVEQKLIPSYFASAKIHLFPTKQEAWGIVVNEASASGTPTISSKNTATVGELVIDGETGWALDLNEELWADKIQELLEDRRGWEQLSKNNLKVISEYNFENGAKGIYMACKKSLE